MAQFGSGIQPGMGLGAFDADSVPAANVQGHITPLSGTNASSDER